MLSLAVFILLAAGSVSSTGDTQNFPAIGEIKICTGEADVILLLDRSGSVGNEDYPYLVGFALHLAATFNISEEGVRLGVASYATTAQREINLNTFGFDAFKAKAIHLGRDEEVLTNIADGLKISEEMLNDYSNGARPGAIKLLIVTNDGLANRGGLPIPVAQELHSKNISIVSVGISPEVNSGPIYYDQECIKTDVQPCYKTKDEESKGLASSPDDYYYIESYTMLNDTEFLVKVTESVCRVVTIRAPKVEDTEASVREDEDVGYLVHTIPFQVDDPNLNKPVFNTIDDGNTYPFSVDSSNGKITLTDKLDYETTSKYVFMVKIRDENIASFFKDIKVTIYVIDVNDNSPIPASLSYSISIPETTSFNTVVVTLSASDKDSGTNAAIAYKITKSDDTQNQFALDSKSGALSVVKELDREVKASYSFDAVAVDKDGAADGKVSATIKITVIITDVNDSPPTFSQSDVSLKFREDQPLGVLYTVSATDGDAGDNGRIVYTITNGNEALKFSLDKNSGDLTLLSAFNFEEVKYYKLTITATDHGIPALKGILTVHINIEDVDEPLTIDGPFDRLIPENLPANQEILSVKAVDPESSTIQYAFTDNTSPFSIDNNGKIVLTGSIDREGSQYIYMLNVTATAGSHTVFTAVKITVTDYNDNSPKFSQQQYTGSIPENANQNDVVTMPVPIKAADGDATSPNNQFHFSILLNTNEAFAIDSESGVLSVNNPSAIDYEGQNSITIFIRATDKGSPTLSGITTVIISVLNVNDNKPVFNNDKYTKTIPENTDKNTNILQVQANDDDGETLSYAIADSGLPFGINSGGQIYVSGELDIEKVPSYSFQVTASDGKHIDTATVEITLTDVNDETPEFKVQGPLTMSVNEDEAVGHLVTTLAAMDADLTSPNHDFMITIESGNTGGAFQIDTNTGALTVAGALKHDLISSYKLIIKVEDKGTNPSSLSSSIVVNINIILVNTAAPSFIGGPYVVNIDENLPLPDVIKVSATDVDAHETLTFSIQTSNAPFTVDGSGQIKATTTFDAEKTFVYLFTCRVTDKGGLFTETTVTVNVNDLNDVSPEFILGPNSFTNLKENTMNGTILGTYSATDGDRTAPNNLVTLSIVGGSGAHFFDLDKKTGELRLIAPLDFEKLSEFNLVIRATDGGTPSLYTDKGIEIGLININEHPPTFKNDEYKESVLESQPNGFLVLTVIATDSDADSSITYSIPSDLPFSINSGGQLHLKSLNPPELPLDFETQQKYEFHVTATDNGNLQSKAKITINVIDVNDNKPIFGKLNIVKDVDEDLPLNSLITSVIATDKDSGNNGEVHYDIIDGNGDNKFYIVKETGEIKLLNELDFETKQQYVLTIRAADKGNPAMFTSSTTHATVTINVLDVNEKPVFLQFYQVKVDENVPTGTVLITCSAEDKDNGLNGMLTYSIVSGNDNNRFELDENTGVLKIKNELDFEQVQQYVLTVRAADKGTPSLDTSGADTNVTIYVQDKNDKPYFDPIEYSATFGETTAVGSDVVTVIAKDEDTGAAGELMYSIVGGNVNNDFAIDMNSGKITIANILNFNLVQKYELVVRATDKGQPSQNTYPKDATVKIIITDDNNNPPIFNPVNYTKSLSESTGVSSTVLEVFATDKDSGSNQEITYSIIDGNDAGVFDIDIVTGIITLVKPLDFETMKQFLLKIRATDKGIPSLSSNPDALVLILVTNVNEHAPVISNLPQTVELNEDKTPGFNVYQVIASDQDGDAITFSIPDDIPFSIGKDNGIITTKDDLDREQIVEYRFSVTASDGKLFDQKFITIKITDVNDNNPIFNQEDITVDISENEQIGFECATVVATDKDEGVNQMIVYTIVGGNDEDIFDIDPTSGLITLKKQLDFETTIKHVLTVRATDKGEPAKDSSGSDATVTINVIDYNDNKPIFKPVAPVTLPEDSSLKVIRKVVAEDKDSGQNGLVMYSIVSGNEDEKFTIDMNTGEVSLIGSLDFEVVSSYKLVIRATDKGIPALTSEPDDAVLMITVTDVNDNSPIFKPKEYETTVAENSPNGTVCVTVSATDKDSGNNGKIMYSIESGNEKGLFDIDMITGEITVVGQIDREVVDEIILIVKATDKGMPSRSSTAKVTITITDENDNAPQFPGDYEKSILESTQSGTTIIEVSASDKDIGNNGEIMYSIASGNDDGVFDITMDGKIILKKGLDFEVVQKYTLVVEARDKGVPSKVSLVKVVINILDVNDNPPIFKPTEYTSSLSEQAGINTVIVKVVATDEDSGDNGMIIYSILKGDENLFSIDPTSGKITLIGALDFETKPYHELIITATDKGSPAMKSDPNAVVKITVTNENDQPPTFIEEPYKTSIDENVDISTIVFTVKATDGDNDPLSYKIITTNVPFEIDSSSGVIKTSGNIDREEKDQYSIDVEVSDGVNVDKTTVMITVNDLNDNQPKVEDVTKSFPEDQPVDSILVTISATDADDGDNSKVMYAIAEGNEDGLFEINMNDGMITLKKPFDFEQKTKYVLTVNVTDKGEPALWTTATLTFMITDVNDNNPICADFSVTVPENIKVNDDVVAQVKATDADSGDNAILKYSITGGNVDGKFHIHAASGMITAVNPLDFETTSKYILTVTIEDHGKPSRSTTCTVTVHVTDVNDNKPVFEPSTYMKTIKETTKIGTVVEKVVATDKDSGDNGMIIYEIVGGNRDATNDGAMDFAINPTTGDISVTSQLDASTPKYELNVTATDKGQNPLTSFPNAIVTILVLNVNIPPYFTTTFDVSIPESIDEASTVQTITAADEDGDSLTYMITTVGVPFKIDSLTGVITRTTALDRETVDSYMITVKVSDGEASVSTTFTITITDVNDNTPEFVTEYKETLREDTPVNQVIVTVEATDKDDGDNKDIMYTITGGNQEDKFEIDMSSGKITLKNPLDFETTASYELTVTATDKGETPLSSSTKVKVQVTDVNDNYPIFDPTEYNVEFPESVGNGTVCVTVTANDADSGENGELMYSIVEGNQDGIFEIDMVTGTIKFVKSVDFETKSVYVLKVRATDKGSPSKHSITDAKVTVVITDINDNKPVFGPNVYEKSVSEDKPVGHEVVTVTATDKDSGANQQLMFSIVAGNSDGKFEIDMNFGNITLKEKLNYEERKYYELTVQAADKGTPSLTSMPNAIVKIHVTNTNDNSPIFQDEPYEKSIKENSVVGTTVIVVRATDADGDKLTYSITTPSVPFDIDGDSGLITTNGPLDREVNDKYEFVVVVTDGKTIDESTVKVIVTDMNDNAPVVADVTETIPENTPNNTVVAEVIGTDADIGDNGLLMYTITNGNGDAIFGIDMGNGKITLLKQLDFETVQQYVLTVSVEDKGLPSLSATATVIIKITDVNDNAPKGVDFSVSIPENTPASTVIHEVNGTDEDSGDNAKLMYMITAGNGEGKFFLNKDDGKLSVVGELDFEKVSEYELTITISDKGQPSQSTTITGKIDIINVNDNKPTFLQRDYDATIPETTPAATEVVTVIAKDLDSGVFGKVTYEIVGGNEDATNDGVPDFKINPETGVIVVNSQLDASTPVYMLQVKATDAGGMDSPFNAKVTITVTNVNVGPTFTNEPFKKEISENTKEKTVVKVITATDPDGDALTYSIESKNVPFTIDGKSGEIIVSGELDRETTASYELSISVTDGLATASTICSIVITDYNDNAPVFTDECYRVTLPENSLTNQVYLTVEAKDKDEGANAQIMYTIIDGNDEGRFEIDMTSGKIKLIKSLDYETQSEYNLTVQATDKGSEPLSSTVPVKIQLSDVNDNSPIFNPTMYQEEFPEDVDVHTVVTTVKATDADSGPNGMIEYEIISGNEAGVFKIDMSTGKITFQKTVDFETTAAYELTIRATDKGEEPRSSDPNAVVKVTITDVNDNAPVFEFPKYTRNIPETTKVGTVVVTVKATDKDSGLNKDIKFSIKSGNDANDFQIDMVTGEIKVNEALDFNDIMKYDLIVTATDQGKPQMSSDVSVTITITDVNMPPVIEPQSAKEILDNTAIDTLVLTVAASDPDMGTNGEIMYEILDGPSSNLFKINMLNGQILVGGDLSTATPVQHKLTVKVSDKGSPSLSDVEDFIINVKPSNHPPTITPQTPISIREDAPVGSLVTTVVASDSDEGQNGVIMYSITGGNGESGTVFIIDMNNGEIKLNETLSAAQTKQYSLQINVADKGTPSLFATTVIHIHVIAVSKPVINNVPLKICVKENQPVGTLVLTVQASDADNDPLTFSLTTSSLPFTINAKTGEIKTTAVLNREEKDDYQFEVQVSDGTFTVSAQVDVCVDDENDVAPVVKPISAVVCENAKNGHVVTTVVVTDADLNSTFTFKITSSDKKFPFEIDSKGRIILTGFINFEQQSEYRFKVEVSDGKHTVHEDGVITICNINEHNPVFDPTCYNATIMDGSNEGTHIVQVTATDEDKGKAGVIRYSIVSGNEKGWFRINHANGKIKLAKKIRVSETTTFTLMIKATDKGVPPRSSDPNAKVSITVKKNPLCQCNLKIKRIPELRWGKRKISRSLPGHSYMEKIQNYVELLKKKLLYLKKQKALFILCKQKIKRELISKQRSHPFDKILTHSCQCDGQIRLAMKWIPMLEKKIVQYRIRIQRQVIFQCRPYCQCKCDEQSMAGMRYYDYYHQEDCELSYPYYKTCNTYVKCHCKN